MSLTYGKDTRWYRHLNASCLVNRALAFLRPDAGEVCVYSPRECGGMMVRVAVVSHSGIAMVRDWES